MAGSCSSTAGPRPRTKLFGWAQGFEPETGGDAVLRYDTSPLRYGVLAFQALFWLLALRFARRVRRRGNSDAPDPDSSDTGDSTDPLASAAVPAGSFVETAEVPT